MTIADDMQSLVNQVAANTAAIAALQAQGGGVPTLPTSGWPITPQQFDQDAGQPGHDSTAAIAAAISACPPGGKVAFPAGSYSVSNGFTIAKPIGIEGDGVGSLFVGALPVGVDLFHVIAPANTTLRGFSFSHFQAQLTSGGHLIHFDTTAANANIADVDVIKVLAALAPGSHGIFIDNAATNPNGGTFDANFEHNVLTVNGTAAGCIYIVNGGDSIHIHGGILTGTGYGIYSNQIANAGNLVVDGAINITANGGVVIARGVKPIITEYEMEFSAPMLTGAGINFAGNVGPIVGGTIGPGQIQILPGAAGTFGEAVYINNASDVGIDGLELASGIGGTGLYITAAAVRTRIGIANAYTGFATTVLDSSTTTQYAK